MVGDLPGYKVLLWSQWTCVNEIHPFVKKMWKSQNKSKQEYQLLSFLIGCLWVDWKSRKCTAGLENTLWISSKTTYSLKFLLIFNMFKVSFTYLSQLIRDLTVVWKKSPFIDKTVNCVTAFNLWFVRNILLYRCVQYFYVI